MIEVVSTGDRAVWKFFVERAVVAETRGDVSPFGEERLIGSAASDVATDGHGAEGASVVALAARDDAIAIWLTAFEMKLSGQLEGSFRGFRAAGSEIEAAAGAKIRPSEGEEAV